MKLDEPITLFEWKGNIIELEPFLLYTGTIGFLCFGLMSEFWALFFLGCASLGLILPLRFFQ